MKKPGLHIRHWLLFSGLHDKQPEERVLFAQAIQVPFEKNDPKAHSKHEGVFSKNDCAQLGSIEPL
jgi:hypothetical protein